MFEFYIFYGIMKIRNCCLADFHYMEINTNSNVSGRKALMINRFKEFLNTSFVRRIVFKFVLIYIVLLACFGLITYMLTRMYIISDTENNLRSTSGSVSAAVDEYMTSKVSPLRMLASNRSVQEYLMADKESAERPLDKANVVYALLDSVNEYDGDIKGAWIVSDKGGNMLGSSGIYKTADEFELTGRNWYTPLISNQSDSYYWFSNDSQGVIATEAVVTIVRTVTTNRNIIGYAGIEIDSTALFGNLDAYSAINGSYPMLISSNNSVIYAPTSAEFNRIFGINTPEVTSVISRASISSGSEPLTIGNVTHYVNFDRSSVTGWNTVILFDGNVMNGNMNRLFMQEIGILTCLFIIMFIVTANIIKNESKPIGEITTGLNVIKSGTYSARIKSASKNELGIIGSGIDDLAEQLHTKTGLIDKYSNLDQLTGLINRQKFFEIVADSIVTCSEEKSRFAILFLDIDNFKWINDTLGHSYGDQVLITFAEKLSLSLGESVKAARFSGDEFVVLLKIGENNDGITEAVAKLKAQFDNPISVLGDPIYIKYSIGISVFPEDDVTADMLIRDADIAVQKAKERGKGRVAYFNNKLHKKIVSKSAISQQLNSALDKGELFLNYQPIISTQTGDIYGFEVLIRWNSEELGFVPPDEFINIAEETGAIIPIGTWIFESACRFQKKLYDKCHKDLMISINASPVQLKKSNYLEHVKRVLEITKINPKFIQIEITESTLIDFTNNSSDIFNQICDLGISLALDDFGTGYSSLNYLKNFPIKCLKVDKSFVDEIYTNRKDYAITDSIIDLVHNLNIKTVAEGVETVGQFNALKDMKCDYIQGFLMSKPLDEDKMIDFVEKYDALHKPDEEHMVEKERILAVEREEKKQKDEQKKAEAIAEAAVSPDEE